MGENGEAGNNEGRAPLSVQGATTPPREKRVIEGEAIRLGDKSSGPSAEEAPDLAAMGLARPVESGGEPPLKDREARNQNAREPAPRLRRGVFPLAAAVILGAAIAVVGALALHHLDQSGNALDTLKARIDALEHQLQSAQAAQPTTDALDKRVSALEQSADFTHKTILHLQAALQQLQSDVPKGNSGTGAPADLAPLTERIVAIENKLAALDQKIDATATKFSDALRSLQNDKAGAAQTAISRADVDAIAILAANLRRKVDAGAPFADELAALTSRGVDKEKLAALAPVAESGAPTQAALLKQFAALSPQLFASGPEPKNIWARFVHDARHLIRIHKVGDTEGNDLSSEIARIQAALEAAKFQDALQEWSALPETAKTQTRDFGEALQRRVSAESAAQAIEAEALAALAKVKS